jgi:hypothetical protein
LKTRCCQSAWRLSRAQLPLIQVQRPQSVSVSALPQSSLPSPVPTTGQAETSMLCSTALLRQRIAGLLNGRYRHALRAGSPTASSGRRPRAASWHLTLPCRPRALGDQGLVTRRRAHVCCAHTGRRSRARWRRVAGFETIRGHNLESNACNPRFGSRTECQPEDADDAGPRVRIRRCLRLPVARRGPHRKRKSRRGRTASLPRSEA